MLEKIHDILHFWFGEDQNYAAMAPSWWQKDEAFDNLIKEKFEPTLICATNGQLKPWLEQSISCLAYIILLDQFSRNIYRNTPQAFSYDDLAKRACLHALENEFDKDLDLVQRQFMYMPLMHSELVEDQKHCVGLFKKLYMMAEEQQSPYQAMMKNGYEYAIAHYEIVERFNRFPHRNEILGRESTEEEKAFLLEPNSGF